MKALILFSDNMEDMEALGTRALLCRAKMEVISATFLDTLDIKTAFGLKVKADMFAKNIKVEDYALLVLPGGPYVGEIIERDHRYGALAEAFIQADKTVAAICAAPRFLGRAGLLGGKKFTAYPGSENDAPNGRYRRKKSAVVDGQIITGRGPGAVYDFSAMIVKTMLGTQACETLKQTLCL